MPLSQDSAGTEDPTKLQRPHIVGESAYVLAWAEGQSSTSLGAASLRQTPQSTCLPTPGIQSPDQQAALARHDPSRPVFVEGPFSLWLRDKCVYYHILRADPLPPEERVRALGSAGGG